LCCLPPANGHITSRCRADKVLGLKNSETVRGFAKALSATPLTDFLYRGRE
jgi:hypothetical protein